MSSAKAWNSASSAIRRIVAENLRGIEREVTVRAYLAANELRSASLHVLRGQRSGRRYRIPFTKKTYQASAPGEPPAVRTGIFRLSWGTRVTVSRNGAVLTAVSSIESGLMVGKYVLGELLEDGTKRMKERPFKARIKEMADPKIRAVYDRPYKI